KMEMDCFTTLSKVQSSLYKKTVEYAMMELKGMYAKDHQSLFKRQGLILQLILSLKQICNHPYLYLKDSNREVGLSGKMDALFEKMDIILENQEKVLIFTQFREMGNMIVDFIQARYDLPVLFYHGG